MAAGLPLLRALLIVLGAASLVTEPTIPVVSVVAYIALYPYRRLRRAK